MFESLFGMGAPKKPTANELRIKRDKERREREAKIDSLLDELNDYKRLYAEFGGVEYKTHIERIHRELTELTA